MIEEFDNVEKLRMDRCFQDKKRENDDTRDGFQKDYGRLIHSPAFRRLQGKSQVFGAGSGDYYRTRLTHTLEVAQIARQIAQRLSSSEIITSLPKNPGLQINPLVVECAALAHDLGHPPFGHKGEHDLDRFLKEEERYEGNAQNFRILMNIEKRYSEFDGLNLTHAVLLAINKYPYSIEEHGSKGLYKTEWPQILEIRKKWNIPVEKPTLEAQLMDISDDIAYSTHDIEDGMKAEKIRINYNFFMETPWLKETLVKEVSEVTIKNPTLWEGINVKKEIARVLEDYLKTWNEIKANINNESLARQEFKAHYVNLFANRVGVIEDNNWFKVSLVKKTNPSIEDSSLWRYMIILKKLAWVTLVEDLRVQRLQKRGEIIITGLWNVFSDQENSSVIPKQWLEIYNSNSDKVSWKRFVADYISGMTDSYAEKLYSELYGSKAGNIYGE